MKFLGIGIAAAVVAFANALSIAAAATDNGNSNGNGNRKMKMKIGLMTAGLPWAFGPYQSQMHQLSLIMNDVKDDDKIEYDIYWLSYSAPHIPKGVYKSYDQLRQYIPSMVPPPAGFPMDHLTFLGQTMEGQMSASKFNEVQKEYGLDCLVTLMDITKVVPDVDFSMPVLAWIPLHSETVSSATVDYWVLRRYHAVAALAPSSAKAINDAVGKDVELVAGQRTTRAMKDLFGTAQVDFIPHIFDRKAISSSADVGLDLLKDHSVAEADAKLKNSPTINRGRESTLEPGHPRSLFGKERKDDFVILLQGGNYDTIDRKGWDISFQAFMRFYNSLDDPSGVHLLIHPMESYLVSADIHSNMDAPAAVIPKGVQIHFVLHEHGLPRDAYTINIAMHAPEVVAAYKKISSVCLHPSKVEGFGMNVMECQMLGTPVITTNFTAMGDYTKLGRSVPHRQMVRTPSDIYDMALPDAIGIADALGELYEEHLAMKRGDKEALTRRESEVLRFNDWIDRTCSPDVVGDKFKSLLLLANTEFYDRKMGKQALLNADPPTIGAYEIASGYHSTIVDWDAPYTLFAPDGLKIVDPKRLQSIAWTMFLQVDTSGGNTPPPDVMVLPAKYEDGTDVPFMNDDHEVHEDLPIFVRTYMVTALQGRMSRRKSLVKSAIQASGVQRQLAGGMAIIERMKDSGSSSRQSQNSEL